MGWSTKGNKIKCVKGMVVGGAVYTATTGYGKWEK